MRAICVEILKDLRVPKWEKPLDRDCYAHNVSRSLRRGSTEPCRQARYYDFNMVSERKRIEKLRYMQRNPVTRGLLRPPSTGDGAVSATT
jgi:putative transposase